ncbi:CD44 antigen-like [Arapaima gigas]
MWTLMLGATFSLLVCCRSDQVRVVSRSCSYMGVFHVEGGTRYALNFVQARGLCQSLGATLATEEQIYLAYNKGMETCRYGWISNWNTTILRHTPHFKCASNLTGVIFHNDNLTEPYDAYCYNKSDLSEKNCQFKISRVSVTTESSSPAREVSTATGQLSRLLRSVHQLLPRIITPLPGDSSSDRVTSNTTPASTTQDKQRLQKGRDWIIILLVILAVVLIILVCLCVAFRKSLCGRREKLKITTEKTTQNTKATGGSQEMVTLMGEEKVQRNGSTEEPLQV